MPQPREIERHLGLGVGDPQAATRVDEPQFDAGRGRDLGRKGNRLGDMLHERIGVPQVRGSERMDAEQLEVR